MVATSVAVLNIVLGLVYLQYGTLTLADLYRNRDRRGFSHFGMAWVAMAFTCGPHHLVHGIHTGFEGRAGGPLDLFVVIVGFPAGVIWFLLRVEAFAGGRGDRHIAGTPGWLMALPVLAGAYMATVVAAMLGAPALSLDSVEIVAPNILLVGIYAAIGYFLIRTQFANRKPLGGWSVSGVALSAVFPTCAIMHGVYAYYGLTGRYHADVHGLVVDGFAVPAGLYFLWVVHSLYRGTYRDWNSSQDALRDAASRAATSPA